MFSGSPLPWSVPPAQGKQEGAKLNVSGIYNKNIHNWHWLIDLIKHSKFSSISIVKEGRLVLFLTYQNI